MTDQRITELEDAEQITDAEAFGRPEKIDKADAMLLLARIDALQGLLAVYRTGGRPTEQLMGRLERTKRFEARIRAELDGAGPVLA